MLTLLTIKVNLCSVIVLTTLKPSLLMQSWKGNPSKKIPNKTSFSLLPINWQTAIHRSQSVGVPKYSILPTLLTQFCIF